MPFERVIFQELRESNNSAQQSAWPPWPWLTMAKTTHTHTSSSSSSSPYCSTNRQDGKGRVPVNQSYCKSSTLLVQYDHMARLGTEVGAASSKYL